jgi:hypothetical protein
MKPLVRFRLLVAVIVLVAGSFALPNLYAELLRASPPYSLTTAKIPTDDQIAAAARAAAVAPLRTDLKAELALALATQSLRGNLGYVPDLNQAARLAANRALRAGPHDARLWLALGLLQTQRSSLDPQIAESLKMSYFTAANSLDLVSTRLNAVVGTASVTDADLKELARGDIRLILTRRPDLKLALLDIYRRAPVTGKQFIEESVKAIDPSFAPTLQQ